MGDILKSGQNLIIIYHSPRLPESSDKLPVALVILDSVDNLLLDLGHLLHHRLVHNADLFFDSLDGRVEERKGRRLARS